MEDMEGGSTILIILIILGMIVFIVSSTESIIERVIAVRKGKKEQIWINETSEPLLNSEELASILEAIDFTKSIQNKTSSTLLNAEKKILDLLQQERKKTEKGSE